MFSFRKAILLLAVLALGASMASAQFPGLSCTLNGGAPPLLRAEGLAEEVGQVVIECYGGNPNVTSTINVRAFTPGYIITSRLLGAPHTGKLEAALLIDDPAPGTVNVAPGGNAYLASPIYDSQGNVSAVEWANVAFTPTGSTQVARKLRIVNLRVNAAGVALPASSSAYSVVTLQVAVTGSLTLPLNTPTWTVGFVQRSLSVSVTGASLSQCQPPSTPVTVTFQELFPNAWRTAGNSTAQNDLGQIYNTESMYWDTAPTNWPADAGRATQATQLRIVFSNLPSGVSLGTPSFGPASGGTTFSAAVSGNTITLTVTSANVGVSETLAVSVPVTYPAPPALPGIGTGSVSGSYAPVSTVITPVASPVPRFTDTGAATAAFTISPCETRLLFPFVTSAAGFDTGIAISNTSRDPFGTATQSGTCTLHFYGTPSNLNQTTTVSIGGGQQLLMTLSGGNSAQGLSAVPGFTGYVFAVCNFQYAHGYAFISDLGANKFAQGYIALILGERPISNPNRYGPSPTEALNQ